MITQNDLSTILNLCHLALKEININEKKGQLPTSLKIDIAYHPHNFLGRNNSAIYVNQTTYKLLKNQHSNWIADHTIAVDEDLLKESPLQIIGTIIHEIGHAYNVHNNIPNTEANANIFEIEVLKYLYLSQRENNCIPSSDRIKLEQYFQSRLSNYNICKNSYLTNLINQIKSNKLLEKNNYRPEKRYQSSQTSTCMVQSQATFFNHQHMSLNITSRHSVKLGTVY